MRAGSIVSEAWRNITTATTSVGILSLAFVVLVGVWAVLDTRAIVGADTEVADYRAAAADIFILNSEEQVLGSACEQLTEWTGVTAAGALRASPGGLRLATLPTAAPPLWEATTGFAALITGSETSGGAGGVLLSRSLATTLDAAVGTRLVTADGVASVSAIFDVPEDGRDRTLSYSALSIVATAGLFDACWVQIWPPGTTQADALAAVINANAPSDTQVRITQYNATHGKSLDIKRIYSDRITRLAPAAAAVLGVILGAASVARRRLELASALHAGVARRSLTLQIMLETAVWITLGSLIASCAVVAAGILGNPTDPTRAVVAGLLSLVVGAGAALGGSAVALFWIREEHLFILFKQRT